jgi:TRAP-type C4-dicarboxylate transport system substrate-binding protein
MRRVTPGWAGATAAALATMLVLAACGNGDADEGAAGGDMGDPVTLNLGHPFPAEHHIQVGMLEPFAEDVAEATDGTVTIEIHPAQALTAPTEAYDNAAAGAIDIGWALHGYTPGRFPLTDVVELPFSFESAEQATNALWDLYEEFPEFQDEYGDVKVLALWTHDLGNLYTVGREVTEPDLSGLTLRAPGPIMTGVIEAMGGAGVGMPAPELYDSLDRGVIDGLMIGDTGVVSFALHEVVDHVTVGNFFVGGEFLVINQGSWDSLSEAQQQAIDGLIGRELSLVGAGSYDSLNETQVDFEGWGFTVTDVRDDIEPWRAATQPVIDDWIAAREADGAPGQAMYDRLLEIVGN